MFAEEESDPLVIAEEEVDPPVAAEERSPPMDAEDDEDPADSNDDVDSPPVAVKDVRDEDDWEINELVAAGITGDGVETIGGPPTRTFCPTRYPPFRPLGGAAPTLSWVPAIRHGTELIAFAGFVSMQFHIRLLPPQVSYSPAVVMKQLAPVQSEFWYAIMGCEGFKSLTLMHRKCLFAGTLCLPSVQNVFSKQWPAVGLLQSVPGGHVPPELSPLRQRPFVAAPAQLSQTSLMQENSWKCEHVDVASESDIEPDPTYI